MSKYKPRQVDTDWLKRMISILKDGGTWGWPNASLVYIFDKKNKVATLVAGKDGHEHRMADEVFKAIGWKTKMKGRCYPNGTAS